MGITYRLAQPSDLANLVDLENTCFHSDRLSKRSFKHWIQADHGILLVAESDQHIIGYGLIWCQKGTRLARLYSLAIHPNRRGQNIAQNLLKQLEQYTLDKQRYFIRLEVSKLNLPAIALYQGQGYRVFGEYCRYYDDNSDAYRMHKRLSAAHFNEGEHPTPWYCQTTDFTCGPSALIMAMAKFTPALLLQELQELELDIWREATTIFMTSGHGGCHPIGLALSAQQRGFEGHVYLSQSTPLFTEGVRSDHKKSIITTVHNQFVSKALSQGVTIDYIDIDQAKICSLLTDSFAVVILISTYRLDGRKAPHWVTVIGFDDHCFYVHDPDIDTDKQIPMDCQQIPICRDDFEKMSTFGTSKLRAAIALKPHRNQNC